MRKTKIASKRKELFVSKAVPNNEDYKSKKFVNFYNIKYSFSWL